MINKKNMMLIVWLLGAAMEAQAATYHVSPSGSDANNGTTWALAKQTIQAGINVAANGDTVLVADGVYNLTSQITISESVTVRSVNGAEATILDGGGVTRCAYLYTDAVLDGFTLTNGYSRYDFGGGVYIQDGTLENCTISGNTAYYGGGVAGAGDSSTLENCTISGNTANGGDGGGVYFFGTLENCTISGNTADDHGGGVDVYGGTVRNCTISGNTGVLSGGVEAENSTVENCTISGNTSYGSSGGIYAQGCTVENCTISGNTAANHGGGVYSVDTHGAKTTVQDCTITGNTAGVSGGGVVALVNSMVENCTISGNTSYWDGGGVLIHGSDDTLENCTISGNTAANCGGGVYFQGGTVRNCKISENTADQDGGGMYVQYGTVRNCTITENIALGDGGGALLWDGTLENCTISGNTADRAGGTYVYGGTVRNCIAYYNHNTDVIGAISYSCIGTNIGGVGNITNEPQFVSTGTGYGTDLVAGNYRLRPTSPCINVGTNQSWMTDTVDLDDLPRIWGRVVDMGAYEFNTDPGAVQFSPSSYSANEDAGTVTLTVTRTGGSSGSASVQYATDDGTASAGSDYTSHSGMLSWSDGETADKTITISITDDSIDEADETFTATLGNASGAGLGSPSVATVTIIDNEVLGEADIEVSDLKFEPVNLWAGDNPAMISFELANDGPEDLVSPDAQIEISFYLSSNMTLGDGDDIAIGTMTEDITLSAGSQTTIRDPGRAHNADVTIPEGMSGDYYVFVTVRLVSESGLSDPDGAYAMRDGPINVRIHPSDDGDSGDENSGHAKAVNDYDGDGKSDLAVYQDASGYWYILLSASSEVSSQKFGASGYSPVPGDYDGDGKTDLAVYHEASGYWFVLPSTTYSLAYQKFGEPGYEPVSGDFDGDGKTDLTVYHEASGYWFVLPSSTYSLAYQKFGEPGYAPVSGDFDGDGKDDLAVYQESTGYWYILPSSSYSLAYMKFGETGYEPVSGDFDGDGKSDLAVYHEASGYWYILSSESGTVSCEKLGGMGYQPVPGDYDGDEITDMVVYYEASGYWDVLFSPASVKSSVQFGGPGYVPVGMMR